MSYPTYSKYKKSETEWLGEVPEHWEVLSIKRLTPVSRGASPRPIEDPKYFDDEGEYAWVRIADVTNNDHYLRETTQRLSELGKSLSVPLEPGSLFLSIAGSVGKPMITEIKACIHDGFVYFPQIQINIEYLYYIFESGQPYLGLGKMGTQLNLNTDTVGGIKIGLPPQIEQDAIAKFLDWKTGQIDALIAKKMELVEKLKEKRIAVITQAVTKGLDPTIPTRDSRVDWVGQVPEHWNIIPLGFLLTMSGGMTPSTSNAAYWEGEIPWVSPKDMKQARITDSIDRVTEKALEENSLSLIPVGAVLVVVRGMILAHSFPVAITERPITVNQDMKALRCGDQLDIKFLYWCLTGFSKVLSSLAEESAHGTRKVESGTLKKFPFPVPPLAEQVEIIHRLEGILDRLDQMAGATERTVASLSEYRTALITAATTGKIDVNEVQVPAQV